MRETSIEWDASRVTCLPSITIKEASEDLVTDERQVAIDRIQWSWHDSGRPQLFRNLCIPCTYLGPWSHSRIILLPISHVNCQTMNGFRSAAVGLSRSSMFVCRNCAGFHVEWPHTYTSCLPLDGNKRPKCGNSSLWLLHRESVVTHILTWKALILEFTEV